MLIGINRRIFWIFHDDDDVDDAQVSDGPDDDDDEAEVYDDVDDPEVDDDDVDDAQVDDDVEETDTSALPLKAHVVASIHEEAPADAVASENECNRMSMRMLTKK